MPDIDDYTTLDPSTGLPVLPDEVLDDTRLIRRIAMTALLRELEAWTAVPGADSTANLERLVRELRNASGYAREEAGDGDKVQSLMDKDRQIWQQASEPPSGAASAPARKPRRRRTAKKKDSPTTKRST